jgi:hypothetical protein
MIVTFENMQENVPYRWAGNDFWTQPEAAELTDRCYIKIGDKLIDQLTKKDVTKVSAHYNDKFILSNGD